MFEGRKGAGEYGKYWFATSEMHNKAEFDTTFAGRCLQYYLHMHYFRSPCSVIIAHRAPYGDMYMADTTFFYEQREAMQRREADLKQNSKERIKF